MKKLILAAILMAFSAQAHAQTKYVFERTNCTREDIAVAVLYETEQKARFEVGEVTLKDVLAAKLNVAETNFCASGGWETQDDQDCRSLRDAQSEIVKRSQVEVDSGLTNVIEHGEALIKLGTLFKFCASDI